MGVFPEVRKLVELFAQSTAPALPRRLPRSRLAGQRRSRWPAALESTGHLAALPLALPHFSFGKILPCVDLFFR
jgi:hypothetical protein